MADTIDESKNGVLVPWDQYHLLVRAADINNFKIERETQDRWDQNEVINNLRKTLYEKEKLITDVLNHNQKLINSLRNLNGRTFWQRVFNKQV